MIANGKAEALAERYLDYDFTYLFESSFLDNDVSGAQKEWLEKLLYQHFCSIAQKYKNRMAEKEGHSVLNSQISTRTLVQEIYVKLFSSKQSLQSSEKKVLIRIIDLSRSVILDRARKINSGKERFFRDCNSVELKADEQITDIDRAKIVALHRAIDRLEAEYPELAEIYVLKEYGGFAELEIANMLDKTRHQVRKMLDHAHKNIRKLMLG